MGKINFAFKVRPHNLDHRFLLRFMFISREITFYCFFTIGYESQYKFYSYVVRACSFRKKKLRFELMSLNRHRVSLPHAQQYQV